MEDVEKQDFPSDLRPQQSSQSRGLERTTTDPGYGDRVDSDSEDDAISTKASRASGRDLSRTISKRETVLSRIRTRPPIGQFAHPLEDVKTTIDFLVDFEGPDDPYHPVNWPMRKKVIATALYGMTTMVATWASATYSAGQRQISEQFSIGLQVSTLGTTLFLFGFGLGPLLCKSLYLFFTLSGLY